MILNRLIILILFLWGCEGQPPCIDGVWDHKRLLVNGEVRYDDTINTVQFTWEFGDGELYIHRDPPDVTDTFNFGIFGNTVIKQWWAPGLGLLTEDYFIDTCSQDTLIMTRSVTVDGYTVDNVYYFNRGS